MRFFKTVLPLIALYVAALAPSYAISQENEAQNLPPEQRAAFEAVIRDYLLDNPEIITDALNALEVRRVNEEASARIQIIEQESERIFNSKFQAVAGNPDGDVTLVEFYDYNCGFCKRALSDLQTLIDEDPNLRVVLKELPLLGAPSQEAAQVALAAIDADPTKYFDFHTALLNRRGQANGRAALWAAEQAGYDPDALQKATASYFVQDAFNEISNVAQALSLRGTPAYIVGTEVIEGAIGIDGLRARIANMRECGKSICDEETQG